MPPSAQPLQLDMVIYEPLVGTKLNDTLERVFHGDDRVRTKEHWEKYGGFTKYATSTDPLQFDFDGKSIPATCAELR